MTDSLTTSSRSDDEEDMLTARGPRKRQRLGLARQACERCRSKKTRCDEDVPCGPCRTLGAECKYGDRKATRSEASFGTVMSFLRRIESKVERISPQQTPEDSLLRPDPRQAVPGGQAATRSNHARPTDVSHSLITPMQFGASPAPFPQGTHASPASLQYGTSPDTVAATPNPLLGNPISFSAHKVLDWPSVSSLLPDEAKAIYQKHGTNYATTLEMKRPGLPPLRHSSTPASSSKLLSTLSVSVVRHMCNAYFATYNLANPILDQTSFSHHTLAVAIQKGFDYDVESCVVLVVMALGCWAIKALAESGFSLSDGLDHPEFPMEEFSSGGTPGLVFFNESRLRHGFLANDTGMQSCQYHLLSGLFYSQLLRPFDWWASTSRASTCLQAYWECQATCSDGWVADMQSRLYWIAVMFEAVVAEELSLPISRLGQLQEQVPLPRFVKPERYSSFMSAEGEAEDEDSVFYHYHFLSQIVHRILVTRTKNSIYYSSPAGFYPQSSLEDELAHQLQQWRVQLPSALQFDESSITPPAPTCPGDVLVVPWLRSRYLIQQIHLRRPLLHRMLSRPDLRTPEDLQKCTEALHNILAWESIIKVILMMKDCLPLMFNLLSQLFGQLLIVYCLKMTNDPAIVDILPEGYQLWCSFVLDQLEEHAHRSPAVAMDSKIAAILCRELVETAT